MTDTALLGGIRVVDLSQFLPGPYATHLMTSLGADVVKIEPPSGDPMRYLMCPRGAEVSPLYQAVNAGKTILRLDLKSQGGKRSLESILLNADVMLDGYRPGVMANLGFDDARLEQINPALIHCHLSGYGASGPYQFRAGHDINYCGLAGLYSHYSPDVIPGNPVSIDRRSCRWIAGSERHPGWLGKETEVRSRMSPGYRVI